MPGGMVVHPIMIQGFIWIPGGCLGLCPTTVAHLKRGLLHESSSKFINFRCELLGYINLAVLFAGQESRYCAP